MEHLDMTILNKNIRSLMKERSITQQQLGDIVGIHQSRVAKCLNDDDSSCFSLEQTFIIANYFGKTIDELIGCKQKSVSYTPDAICSILINLLSTGTIKTFEHNVSEDVLNPNNLPESQILTMSNKYIAFYFPNYRDLPTSAYYLDTFGSLGHFNDSSNINTFPSNMKINTFLKRFLDVYDKYQKKDFSEEEFHILINAYLKMLHD